MSVPPHPEAPDTAPAPGWIAVGAIAGAFGMRGEVKVMPQTDFPERFARTPTVYLGAKHTPYAVESARQHKNLVLLKLAGCETITDAERLRGAVVYVPENEATPLPEGQYYVHDLVGLRVEHINGTTLGEVTDYISPGGNDLFVIRSTETGAEVMLPAVKEFVKDVDLANRVMRVEPIPGLFDANADEAG